MSRQLIEKEFDRTVTMKSRHAAHPPRRDVLADQERRFGADVDHAVHQRFRHSGDVSVTAVLSHYFGFVACRAVPGRLSYPSREIAERRAPVKLARLARSGDADMFCLNDVGEPERRDQGPPGARNDLDRLVRDFLAAYFPLPGSFDIEQSEGPA